MGLSPFFQLVIKISRDTISLDSIITSCLLTLSFYNRCNFAYLLLAEEIIDTHVGPFP